MTQEHKPGMTADKRSRQKEANRQMRAQLQESSRDLLILMRWPITVLAVISALTAIYGWFFTSSNLWSRVSMTIFAVWLGVEAYKGWYYARRY